MKFISSDGKDFGSQQQLNKHEEELLLNEIKTNYNYNISSLDTPIVKIKKKYPKKPLSKEQTILYKYKDYKDRILKKNKCFELTIEEFTYYLSQPCHYCNLPSTGIDRIDSSIGYTHSNCVSCCFICNMMKYTCSQQAFFEQVKRICIHNNLL